MKLARAAILTKEKVTLKLDYRNLVCTRFRLKDNQALLLTTRFTEIDMKIAHQMI